MAARSVGKDRANETRGVASQNDHFRLPVVRCAPPAGCLVPPEFHRLGETTRPPFEAGAAQLTDRAARRHTGGTTASVRGFVVHVRSRRIARPGLSPHASCRIPTPHLLPALAC